MSASYVTNFFSEIKCVENYPDFDSLAHAIQYGLQWFIVQNIEGESTETNDLSPSLLKRVCCVNNSNVANALTNPNPSRGFCNRCTDKRKVKELCENSQNRIPCCILQKFKLLIDRFSSFFR